MKRARRPQDRSLTAYQPAHLPNLTSDLRMFYRRLGFSLTIPLPTSYRLPATGYRDLI